MAIEDKLTAYGLETLEAAKPIEPNREAQRVPLGQPPVPGSRVRTMEMPSEEEEFATLDVAAAAVRQHNITYQLASDVLDYFSGESHGLAPDTTYDFYQHEADLTDGIPQRLIPEIAEQNSLEAAQLKRQEIMNDLGDQALLDRSGAKGTAATVVASMLSIETLVPVANAAANANKVYRLQNAVKVGSQLGILEGTAETIRAANSYANDGENILYNATFAAAIGGGLGAVLGRPTAEVAGEAVTRVSSAQAGDAILRNDMDKALAREITERTTDQGKNFKMTDTEEELVSDAQRWYKNKDVQKAKAGWTERSLNFIPEAVRSTYSTLMKSPSNLVNKFTYDILEGGTGAVGRTRSASIIKDVTEKDLLSRGLIPLYNEFNQYAARMNLSVVDRHWRTESLDDFYKEVRRMQSYKEHGQSDLLQAARDKNPEAYRASVAMDDMMSKAMEYAHKSGWESLQGVAPKAGYVPLKWHAQKFLSAVNRHGRDAVTTAISKGYVRAGLDEEVAPKIANAVVKRLLDRSVNAETNVPNLLDAGKVDELRQMLKDTGLEDVEIDDVLSKLESRAGKSGPGYTKRRTPIDLTVSDNGIELLDLVDNDLGSVLSLYARDLSGRTALASKGIKSNADWDKLRQAMLKDDAGATPNLADTLDGVRTFFDSTPYAGGIESSARAAQQFASISMLGGVGFAQLAELANAVGQYGFREFLKETPEVMSLFRNISKGSQGGHGDVLDELRPIIGDFDYDHLLYRPDIVLDDKAARAGWANTTLGGVINKGLGKGTVLNGYLSGMNHVRHFEHRITMKMAINKIGGFAQKGTRGLSQTDINRLADMGLEGPMLGKAFKEINKHATYADGRITKLDLQKWNPDTMEEFVIALNRGMNQTIQKGMAGETSLWMHRTMGSLLTQFRSFPITAIEKQTLRQLRHMDSYTLTVALYGLAWAGFISGARTAVTTIGNPDKFDERFTAEKMLKDAGNYMAMASLAPDILTVVGQVTGIDTINFRKYGHGASYNQGQFNMIDYIPAAGAVNKVMKGATGGANYLIGDGDGSDLRAAFGAVPFSSTIFGRNLINQIED